VATTDLDICNLALARLGVKALLFSMTDGTPEANMSAQIYPQARDTALSSFPWPFATKRATLSEAVGETRSGWTYCYTYPSDCLTARYIYPGSRQVPYNAKIPYVVEANALGNGRIICTDQASAELVYTMRVTDVPSYPPAFVDALAWFVARDLATPLSNNPQMSQFAGQMFVAAIGNAGSIEFRQSQEDPPTRVEGEYIRARGTTPQSNSSSTTGR
jgi:hypothetical protein